ncbi:MAG: nucleotidyltransferase [Candidatus Omnitrophica bacterium]|nr:nucleotidyltransferase [Candidatus Omnitrophota bacterium]
MDTNIFHLFSDISKKSGISCVLVGGFAVNYYKVTRQTADVDFLIAKEDFEKISGLLEKAGYKKDCIHEVFIKLKNEKPYLMDIDFMLADKETLVKIIKDGERVSIAGEEFIVPSLNNLIALKLHSIKYNPKLRLTKDLPDIINLIRINKVDYESREFRELCLKYGTEEIYKKIVEVM